VALDTLKDIEVIGGFKVVDMDKLREKYPEKFNESGSMDYKWFEKDIRPNHFVYVRHDVNCLSFTIQNGPVCENGINGCQVDTLIAASLHMIKKLNERFPCEENKAAIGHLSGAIGALEQRKQNRMRRGVEGYNKA